MSAGAPRYVGLPSMAGREKTAYNAPTRPISNQIREAIMNRKAPRPILTLLFFALLCVCLLTGSWPERGAASITQLPKWSSDKAVTTNIRDAYPITRWLEGFDRKVKPIETTASFNLPPGYYRFTIQSYCLHAGTWG